MKFEKFIFVWVFMLVLGVQDLVASLTQEDVNRCGDSSALRSYAHINKNWHYLNIPEDFKTDSPDWTIQENLINPTDKVHCLLWNHEVQPCIQEATNSILNSSTYAECFNAGR